MRQGVDSTDSGRQTPAGGAPPATWGQSAGILMQCNDRLDIESTEACRTGCISIRRHAMRPRVWDTVTTVLPGRRDAKAAQRLSDRHRCRTESHRGCATKASGNSSFKSAAIPTRRNIPPDSMPARRPASDLPDFNAAIAAPPGSRLHGRNAGTWADPYRRVAVVERRGKRSSLTFIVHDRAHQSRSLYAPHDRAR